MTTRAFLKRSRRAVISLGAMFMLFAAVAAAQRERTPGGRECRPLVDAVTDPMSGSPSALPEGATQADLDYCLGMPFHDPSVPTPFTVRPREMATATRTEHAGEFTLDSLENYLVYVPEQCVGARRCPLIVDLHGGGWGADVTIKLQRPVADKYGMIVLAPTSPSLAWTEPEEASNRANLDRALKQVLRRFAIDPDKIALMGRCNGGASAAIWGGNNLDVFSRILPISSGYPPTAGVDAPRPTTEFILDAGLLESRGNFRAVRELRMAGHRVKLIVALRGHGEQAEDYDFVGHLLQESWAKPDPATRTAPAVVADPLPVLTVEAVTRMTAFWTAFMREPDSIRNVGRRAHLREVLVPVGEERASAWMTEMPALAAQFPTIVSDLTKAGLTAQQHEAYRVAMLTALVAADVGEAAGITDGTSPLAKNIAFVNAHRDELAPLAIAGIWDVP